MTKSAFGSPGLSRNSTRHFGVGCVLIPILFLLAACGKSAVVGKETEPLRIGYMICNSAEETRRRFEPLTRYLAKELSRPVRAVYLETQDLPEAFEKRELELTHSNSLLYVIMHEKGLLPLAGEKRGSMGSRSAGAIAVRKDSPIKGLADLKGKRMIFGPTLAPTAFLSQYDLLLSAGIDPESDLDLYAIPAGSWKHEKVLYGLWMGAYDAAAVPLLDYEQMLEEKKIAPGDLRLLAVNDPIPYCVFGISPRVPEETAAALAKVLFNLSPAAVAEVDGEVLRVLKAAEVDGFVEIRDGDFSRVREMARRAHLPPFQGF